MASLRKAVTLAFASVGFVFAQEDNLGLGNGFIDLTLANFKVQLVRDAQVLASLQPSDSDFDFLPNDLLDVRARNGQYHWGDITYRYREEGATEWTGGDSAAERAAVQEEGELGENVEAASNMAKTLPDSPLDITREWIDVDGDLGLRFRIENTGDSPIELGSLGFPAEFNSIFTLRQPEEMQAHCSLSDPYIGLHAGHIRVTPVKGTGQALVVTPLNNDSPLEAYRNLQEPSFEETAYGSQTFEGFYEWQVLSQAWADDEWEGQEPWNPPSAATIAPGDSLTTGVRFSLADGVRGFDDAVRKTGTPVAKSVPGYILPRDQPAQLWLDSDSTVSSTSVTPEGALNVEAAEEGRYTVTPSDSAWGRVRLSVEYEDGKIQTIHYYITKSTTETLSDMGSFLTTEAYFNDSSDPFGRSPSVMTYDYEEGAIVEQDSRAWVAGLSDEGGTGAYVAAMMKQVIQPEAEEISKLEAFVNEVVWGTIQVKDHGVRKSIFFYEPSEVPDYQYDDSINWESWTSWNKEQSYNLERAYNYVHVAVAHWSLYRIARAYPELLARNWTCYLNHAQKTVVRMTQSDVAYKDVGLMGETVFGEILKDLQREGNDSMATELEDAMRVRAELWHSQEIPYGSEMAWDSTGQEGVYYWTRHFDMGDSVTKTINSVLGYMPNVPHWGWDGNARRYWDNIYGGKLQRIERQIHHYGSGLNAQVLLGAFRDDPSDSYLLRTGYAGASGPLTNINQDGFPSASFHSWPDTLKWDGITGDYGGGFIGLALNSGTYVADDGELGLVAYGGILSNEGGEVSVQVRAPVRRRVFVGPLNVLFEIDAGAISEFSYNSEQGTVSVSVAQQEGSPSASKAAIWVESTAGASWSASSDGEIAEGRGGWVLSLSGDGTTSFTLTRA